MSKQLDKFLLMRRVGPCAGSGGPAAAL